MRRNYWQTSLKKLLLLCFSLVAADEASAQRIVNQQALYWIRYQNQLTFSPTVYWNNEFDNRRFIGPDVQNQFIIHSNVHYEKKAWDIGAGVTVSWVYAQKPEQGYDYAVNELRGVQEVSHDLALGKVTFQNRIRLDHRFFEKDRETSVFDESTYVFRFRYRAQLRIPVKKNEEGVTTINIRVADEVMLNHTGNTFDQNRISVTSDFFLSEKFVFELGYIYIYQQRLGQEEFFERHVARFTVLHKLAW
jgi:hypothetical protein